MPRVESWPAYTGGLPLDDLHFESFDLAETEDFLTEAYTAMRIGGRGQPTRTQVDRRWLGPVSLDSLAFSFDMDFTVLPLNKVPVGQVHSGHIETRFGQVRDVLAPGDVALITPPDTAYSGQVSKAVYHATMLDPDQLDRVASPGDTGAHVKLTGHRPVSRAAGNQLGAFIGYLRERVRMNPEISSSQLVTSTAAMHLAAVVLATFPTNAQLEPTAADRGGPKAALLRRAIAYIDESAQTDISIVDIAKQVNMTPRGVQYMFRRELDCTPMEYVRRVRLEHAHRELVSSNPDTTSVSQIATRWGFAHRGRFARHYRQAYGKSPQQTLHG